VIWRIVGVFCGILVAFAWLFAGHGYGVLLPECQPILDGMSLATPLPLQWAYQIEDSEAYRSSLCLVLVILAGFAGLFGRFGALASVAIAVLAGLLAALPWIGLQAALGQLNSGLTSGARAGIGDLLVLSETSRDLTVSLDFARAEYAIVNNGFKPHTVTSVAWLLEDGSKFTSTEKPGVILPLKGFPGKLKMELKNPKARPTSGRCVLTGTDERVPALPIFVEVHF
jgi:hypothetical protein